MNRKFKITEYWKNKCERHYNVKVEQDASGCFESLQVKNKSIGLYDHYRGTVECTINMSGNDYVIKTENNEFTLDICEIHAVSAAFLALDRVEGGRVKIKERGECTCKS